METEKTTAVVEISPVGTVSKFDWKKIGKGALIAAGGSLSIYVAGLLQAIDWSTIGQYGIFLAPLASILINFLNKWWTQKTNVLSAKQAVNSPNN